MKIYLIGYMGVGKTSIGKRLAGALDLPFYDLDDLISKREGQSIVSIFDAMGELGFRQKETELLRKFPEIEAIEQKEESQSVVDKGFVLATGGGTPCQYQNMDFMLDAGLTIWLKMEPKMLADRLKAGKSKRPLIADIADEDLPAFIKENLEMRYPYYSKAAIHFDAANFDSERLAQLVDRVKNHSR